MEKGPYKRPKNIRRILGRLLRLAVMIGPVTYVGLKLDSSRLLDSIFEVAWWTVPVLILNSILAIFLQGYRWWLLLREKIPGLSLARALNIHLRSNYYSLILPTSAAQDVVRAAILSKEKDYRAAWAASWMARLLGLGVLSLLSVGGLWTLKASGIPRWVYLTVYTASGAILVLGILSFTKSISRSIRPLMHRFLPTRVVEVLEGIRQSVFTYRDRPAVITNSLLATLLVQLVMLSNVALVIYGISGKFLWFESLAFMSVIEIVCIAVPLTPNGVGVREILLIGFFDFYGLSQEALAMYIALAYLSVGSKFIGGIPILLEKLRPPFS